MKRELGITLGIVFIFFGILCYMSSVYLMINEAAKSFHQEGYKKIQVDCYDRYGNKIIGQTCEKLEIKEGLEEVLSFIILGTTLFFIGIIIYSQFKEMEK